MKKVKEMSICFIDYIRGFVEIDSKYYDVETIVPDLIERRDKEQESFLTFFRGLEFVKETDPIKIDEHVITIKLSREISIEECLNFVHILEEKYVVTEFFFQTEYDDWYDEDPNITISVRNKI